MMWAAGDRRRRILSRRLETSGGSAAPSSGDSEADSVRERGRATQVARIIAHFVVFLELTDEDALDPDDAVETMEYLGHLIDGLDRTFLRELVDAFPVIAEEYGGDAQKVVRDIAHSFYLEEALADGDPVRLAELEAIRDARD